jgi:hypothetical protein
MKRIAVAFLCFAIVPSAGTSEDAKPATPAAAPKTVPVNYVNPAIDMEGYLKVAKEAAEHRATRRVSEDEFIRLSREPGTIVLDARSKALFDLLHVKGAINLTFPDIAVETLKKTLPDRDALILIYCNNNFTNEQRAFPTKALTASLNISTYIALYNYGYRNVYELAPQIDVKKSKLEFESTPKK